MNFKQTLRHTEALLRYQEEQRVNNMGLLKRLAYRASQGLTMDDLEMLIIFAVVGVATWVVIGLM